MKILNQADHNKINQSIIYLQIKMILRRNSPGPLTDDWKVTNDSSVNFYDGFLSSFFAKL